MSFQARWVFPEVCHIEDAMGVCMTLLVGHERALLVDTGYGLEDVSAFVRSLTDRPADVLLTHGHHDHALGAGWFPQVYAHPLEIPVYRAYTRAFWRGRVLNQARDRGIKTDGEAYLAAVMPEALPAPECFDLGGLTAQVILCPGHTPGSLIVYVPERKLLLTGDDWNPVTWAFFPEAMSVTVLRDNLRRAAETLPFEHVLCPHRPEPHRRGEVTAFLDALTDEAVRGAKAVDTGTWLGIETVQADLPQGQCVVFDRRKANPEG